MRAAFFTFLILAYGNAAAWGAAPTRPEFGVLDQASILPLQTLKAMERVLSEHERLTQERISVITLASSPKGGLDSFADATADEWRKMAPRPPSTVTIFIDDQPGDLEMRTGLGIDPILPESKIRELEKTLFNPEWDGGKKSRAAVLTVMGILQSLESPLISSGEAVAEFERGGFVGGWNPTKKAGRSWTPWVLALLGIAATGFVLARILIGEVHYTASGWFPVPAARNLKRLFRRKSQVPKLVTGGGISGSY